VDFFTTPLATAQLVKDGSAMAYFGGFLDFCHGPPSPIDNTV
jgi:hypothetical protein